MADRQPRTADTPAARPRALRWVMSGRARPWVMPLAVFLLGLAVHLPALWNDFVYDDFPELTANPVIEAPFSVRAIFSSEYWAGFQGRAHTGYYRPVPLLIQKAVRDLFGLRPLPLHALVVSLHSLLAALIALFLQRRCGLSAGAFAAGALFAVHTANTEAAVCSYGLKEVLAGLLPFGALFVYSGWSPARPVDRLVRLVAASLLLAAGLLSKESSLGFVLALPAWDLFGRAPEGSFGARIRTTLRPTLLHTALFLAVLFAALSLRAPVLGGLFEAPPGSPINNPLLAEPGFVPRIATAFRVAWLAFRILLLPLWLSHDYSADAIPVARTLFAPDVLAGAIVLLGLAVLLARAARLRPPATVGAIVAASSYLLFSNLALPLGTLFSERFLYIPSIGLALVLAPYWEAVAERLARTRRSLPSLAFAIALAGLSVLTLLRTRVYKDEDTLVLDAYAHYPANVSMQDAVAGYLVRKHDYERAGAMLAEVARRQPDLPFLVEKRARLLLAQGKREEGMALLEEATRRPEADVITFRDYAERLASQGKVREAIDVLSRGLREPFGEYKERAKMRELRGALLLHVGKTPQALVDLRVAVATDPGSADAWSDLSKALAVAGRDDESAAAAERALALQPWNREMLSALGAIETRRRDFASAAARYRKIVELDPTDVKAANSLGGCLIALGRPGEARPVFEAVLARAPDDRFALASLGSIEEAGRDRPRALALYERFLSSPQPEDDLTRQVRQRLARLRSPS